MRWWLMVGAALGVAAWWWFGDDEAGGVIGDVRQVFRDAINGIAQGARLTHAPYDKSTGVAPGDPAALAASAGLDLNTYALARMIASEEGNSSTAVQALIAHAAVNHAGGRERIAAVLLKAKNPAHNGFFGTQKDLERLVTTSDGKEVHPSDRYASTASDPYEGHAAVARGVLDGSIPDLTGGADQFDRPSGERDPAAVAAAREGAGKEEVSDLADLIGDDLRFWRQTEAS
jgi:hypothetical protein